MQNKRVQVLSTKVLDDGLLQKAACRGIDVTCVPFIETRPVIDEALNKTINALSQKQVTAIFTSSKSVTTVGAVLAQQPVWNIYSLFGATKEQVQKHFSQSIIHAEAKDSAALAEQLLTAGVTEAHFFCGDRRMDTIPQKLAATDVLLHQHIVYATHAAAHKIGQPFDCILFFSPSAVESFFSVNKPDGVTKCFAVGNTTARHLQSYTGNIITASLASGEAMLDKVFETYRKL